MFLKKSGKGGIPGAMTATIRCYILGILCGKKLASLIKF
jgi:hypothetical protein